MAKTQKALSGVGRRIGSPGKGQNKWTYDQKLTLQIMFNEFELSAETGTFVFNRLYADHLSACGLPNGLHVNTIKLQYGERNRASAPKIWTLICNNPTDHDESVRRKRISDEITGVLVALKATPLQAPPYPIHPVSSPVAPTPSASTKRARAVSKIRSYRFQDSEDDIQRLSKKPKTLPPQAMVIISQQEQEDAIASLVTGAELVPRKTVKTPSNRRPDATVRYELPSGTTIWLTPEQFRQTKADLVPIDANVAHPHVPLLFRYWTKECLSPLTGQGFKAGRFSSTIIPPPGPPSLKNFPWSCAGKYTQHLNRDRKVASPFISTSNNFVWITRLALKELKRGANHGCISLIDPTLLNRAAIFHAQPIHRELCKKRPFDNAAWFYHGMNEFLVWAEIPREAIVKTLPVQMLLDAATSNPGLGAILRLEQLGMLRTGYFSTLLPTFKEDNITLSKGPITALAQACRILGLDATTVEAVSSVVTDLIKGLAFVMQHKSRAEWQEAASIFSQAMCSQGSSLVMRQNMKYAFLDGCRWSVGDFNARQKPKQMGTMLGRAAKIGLDSPAKLVTSDLDLAKAAIEAFEGKQRSLLRSASSRALLADPWEDDQIIPRLIDDDDPIGDGIDDEGFENVRRRLFRQNDQIVYDYDEDEERSVYEL